MQLLPRISLRQLMQSMVVVAAWLALLSMAWRGNVVAFGLATSLAAIIPVFLVYAFWYWIHFAAARISTKVGPPGSSSDPSQNSNWDNVA